MSDQDRADHMYLSRDEQREFKNLMVKAQWVVDELDITLTRQSQFGNTLDSTGKSTETPVVFHEAAAEIAFELHGTVLAWVNEVCTQRKLQFPGVDRTGRMAHWLWQHVVDVALIEDAEAALDELRDALKRAERVIDRPIGRIYVGPCGTDSDTGRCGADLYATPLKAEVQCKVCGATHEVEKRREALREEVRGLIGTAVELARMLPWILDSPVRENTIRQWAKRKRLVARTTDQTGRPMYRVGDVIDLHVMTKAS